MRRLIDVTVDVGFGEPTVTDPEVVRGPDLLGFAEIPAVEVPALPLEQHIAEKVDAYTRSYAGGSSTRVKDLIDLAAISSQFSFQAGRLRRALEATFSSRGTHALPSAFPPPPAQWRTPYRRMATEVGLDPEVSVGHEQAKAFLTPILVSAVETGARWEPTKQAWVVVGS
ncbi:MAG TPA: nucleotidyl transferase AbiEii/AbiGii toxin family protein [Dehalococcoidia bacterium]|nr:nucleotidyl transferase AbiEii/AbiGii toxin family protein [Dehalococcoidia bacterium]